MQLEILFGVLINYHLKIIETSSPAHSRTKTRRKNSHTHLRRRDFQTRPGASARVGRCVDAAEGLRDGAGDAPGVR